MRHHRAIVEIPMTTISLQTPGGSVSGYCLASTPTASSVSIHSLQLEKVRSKGPESITQEIRRSRPGRAFPPPPLHRATNPQEMRWSPASKIEPSPLPPHEVSTVSDSLQFQNRSRTHSSLHRPCLCSFTIANLAHKRISHCTET